MLGVTMEGRERVRAAASLTAMLTGLPLIAFATDARGLGGLNRWSRFRCGTTRSVLTCAPLGWASMRCSASMPIVVNVPRSRTRR